MLNEIPIQNVYYLLVYAWNRFQQANCLRVAVEPAKNLENLLAKVLIAATDHVLRRGLDRNYVPHREETASIRGRVEFPASLSRLLIPHAKAQCHYDELSYDVLHNQILRTTLQRLSQVLTLDPELRRGLLVLFHKLDGVQTVRLATSLFRQVQLHSNNAFYGFILNICQLVYSSLLPTEDAGHYRFAEFIRDETKMPYVFQDFVFNFYRLEQDKFRVSRDYIKWWAEGDIEDLGFLPSMRTDASLRSRGRTVIIEAKYYKKAFQKHFGSDTLHSQHLYQLFSYLKNLEARDGPDSEAEGILIYPTVDMSINFEYVIHGHRIRALSVDLAQNWRQIHEDLLKFIGLADEIQPILDNAI